MPSRVEPRFSSRDAPIRTASFHIGGSGCFLAASAPIGCAWQSAKHLASIALMPDPHPEHRGHRNEHLQATRSQCWTRPLQFGIGSRGKHHAQSFGTGGPVLNRQRRRSARPWTQSRTAPVDGTSFIADSTCQECPEPRSPHMRWLRLHVRLDLPERLPASQSRKSFQRLLTAAEQRGIPCPDTTERKPVVG